MKVLTTDTPTAWIQDRIIPHAKGALSLRTICGFFDIHVHYNINPQVMHIALLDAGIQCFDDEYGKRRYKCAYILLHT